MLLESVIILVLIILNGILAMSEIAVVSSRKARLQSDAEKGSKRAKSALSLAESPNRLLATVQVGITLVGILMGIFSGGKISAVIGQKLNSIDWIEPYGETIAVALVVLVVTFLALVLGELVPKRIGLVSPEKVSKIIAAPMNLLSKIAAPFVWVLSHSTEAIVKIFNLKTYPDSLVTEEEIKAMVDESAQVGNIEEIEHNIVDRVFHLGDRTISTLMTPRHQLVWLDILACVVENKKRLAEGVHSVYPVCKGGLEHVVGMVRLKDVVGQALRESSLKLEPLLLPPLYFPEHMRAYKALEKFKNSSRNSGLVINEHGRILGIVTITDILNALVGDIYVNIDADPDIVAREDGSWLVDAQLPFTDFLKFFELQDEDEISKKQFYTLGGFVLHILKEIPESGDN
ncbi:MAG: hemolysin family protein, partial [Hymenobacteraceae bacterium]|nr:hemolysin family protein [Hymenobacteraceae bacterium]MDX5396639.1 hemolysin family protein [Hymenobacteraceae bacterium]MDX5442301.1 hemolysin family protein [Hymenobacteraceae bacterium]MDX5512706.1 hemolysin family protein [Hymenobacteraceae bacterium]